jgi:hypothetical protein
MTVQVMALCNGHDLTITRYAPFCGPREKAHHPSGFSANNWATMAESR